VACTLAAIRLRCGIDEEQRSVEEDCDEGTVATCSFRSDLVKSGGAESPNRGTGSDYRGL
jgi:hypothetical protein